jgi:hypothetical protein
MRSIRVYMCAVLAACFLLSAEQAFAAHRVYTATGLKKPMAEKPIKPGGDPKDSEKPFADLIKDRVAISGLFTFYLDTNSNAMYMSIKPDQFGKVFMCGTTISKSEGAFFDNGSMSDTYPFYLKRVGKKVMLMEKNLRYRADTTSTLHRAVESGISDALVASFKVESKPDSSGAILVDPTSYFLRDAENVGYYLGQLGQTALTFDKENSYYETVKSFPLNSELDIRLHYRTNKPQSAPSLQNGTSMYHTYHYSLSALPEGDFVPRLADDRVGHFLTMYADYSVLDSENPYVRYINRWNLKKKDPAATISEPVEPIVYWIENTVPIEYREAVKKGIEFWQPAFEKAGFKNAIIAKQMEDTATWDPADVRYSTVRWILIPDGTYAVGPSRANPFTGQIYDADIRVGVDFIRAMFNTMEKWIGPVTFDGSVSEQKTEVQAAIEKMRSDNPYFCDYEAQSALEASFGLNYVLSTVGDFVDKDSLTQAYVNAYITELVAHEVGHTLGLRHNFKASTIYTLEQLADKKFTEEHSTGGTVMDYTPPNVGGLGRPQGEFYASVPGPYDNWVIEYAYSDFGAKTPADEKVPLERIASRATGLGLTYGTDEDAFGSSPKSIDPMCNLFDMGSDPLAYATHKVKLTRELWTDAIAKFEVPGNRYQKLMSVFQSGWRSFAESAQLAPKYIGGLNHSRSHIGDPEGKLPFEPVSAADQRRAMQFLKEYVFASDAYDLPNNLLNKLAPERLPDFSGSVYTASQVDFPFHQMVVTIQRSAIDKLYNSLTLGRLLNNLERYQQGQEKYTMFDMFTDCRKMIWAEALTPATTNSFRRQLQLVHLQKLIDIYLSTPTAYPTDARTLAANDLDILETAASRASGATGVDEMSRAHYKEVLRQIKAARSAQRTFQSGMTFGFGG